SQQQEMQNQQEYDPNYPAAGPEPEYSTQGYPEQQYTDPANPAYGPPQQDYAQAYPPQAYQETYQQPYPPQDPYMAPQGSFIGQGYPQEYAQGMPRDQQSDTSFEVAEQKVAEKIAPLKRKIEENKEGQELLQDKVADIDARLKRIESSLDKIQ